MNSLKELVEVLAPPESPLEVPAESDWSRCKRDLGMLPSDFIDFLSIYGTGTIDEFLWIFNPASKNEFLEFESSIRRILEALRETASQFPGDFPMPIYPDPGGFLPFGTSDNGDTLFWVTEGEPDEWKVAVMGPRSPDVFHFSGGMVEFLTQVLLRKVSCDRFPDDFPGDPPITFTPTTG